MKLKKKRKKSPSDLIIMAEFLVEEYRFMRTVDAALKKLLPEERKRYISSYSFHESKLKDLMEQYGLRIQIYDGKDYDEGDAVTVLNADEYNLAKDNLVIEQTIEPAIINLEGEIIRQGTVVVALKIEEPQEALNNDDMPEDKK